MKSGVAFFDQAFNQTKCDRFYLFEPIFTAVLMSTASAALALRVAAIHDHNRLVIAGLAVLLAGQIAAQGVSCAFFERVPLQPGQGCIAGPTAPWVGVYWIVPTVLYAVMVG